MTGPSTSSARAGTPAPQELLALAAETAAEAGEMLLHRRTTERVRVAATKSTPTDVVTAMDLAAEDLIRRRLLGARPEDAFLGEEGGGTTGAAVEDRAGRDPRPSVTWVVDPLDGTVNYLYGLPVWAVSIAAEVAGEVVAGVVVCPPTGETWTATRGGGARRNGEAVTVNRVDDLAQALVGTGFWYDAEQRAHQATLLREVLPRVRDIRRIGSAAVDLCGVACGRLDAFYESGLHRWDYAAGLLVAREAGAVAAGVTAEAEPDGRLAVVGAPGILPALHTLLLRHGAEHVGDPRG